MSVWEPLVELDDHERLIGSFAVLQPTADQVECLFDAAVLKSKLACVRVLYNVGVGQEKIFNAVRHAVKNDHMDVLKLLIELKAPLAGCPLQDFLMIAFQKRSLESILALSTTGVADSPLYFPLQKNPTKITRDPVDRPAGGHTALMCACRLGNVDFAKALLSAGSSINAKSTKRWCGAVPDSNNCSGYDIHSYAWNETPLHFAIAYGHYEVTELLVLAGAEQAVASEFTQDNGTEECRCTCENEYGGSFELSWKPVLVVYPCAEQVGMFRPDLDADTRERILALLADNGAAARASHAAVEVARQATLEATSRQLESLSLEEVCLAFQACGLHKVVPAIQDADGSGEMMAMISSMQEAAELVGASPALAKHVFSLVTEWREGRVSRHLIEHTSNAPAPPPRGRPELDGTTWALSELSCDDICCLFDAANMCKIAYAVRDSRITGRTLDFCDDDSDVRELFQIPIVYARLVSKRLQEWKTTGVANELLRPQPGAAPRVAGSVGSSPVSPLSAPTHAFLTHDWGVDENGRSNHARVSTFNAALQAMGIDTWFDEERMRGNIVAAMTSGIDNTKCCVVFITQRYMEKVNGPDARDNCQIEFNYAFSRLGPQKMIAVVMEPRMRNTGAWTGALGAALGPRLFVDMTSDDPLVLARKQEELMLHIQTLLRS